MIYLAILIVVFCIFIIIKEKGASRYFLFTLILGYLTSLFSFIIYLNYLKERQLYLYLFWRTLYVRDFFADFNFSNDINMMVVITLMHLGVLLFIYSCLCFTISFIRPHKSNIRLYILFSISPVIQFMIYCPWVYEYVHRLLLNTLFSTYFNVGSLFYIEDTAIYHVTSITNQAYLGLSVILIIYYYFKTPRLKYFRSYSLFILSGIVSIVLLFYTLFWWAPKRLISVTTISDYVHVLPVSLFFEGRMLVLFPYVTLLSFILLIFAIYRFNSTYIDQKNIRNLIMSSIDISNMGIRIFTHMIKNCALPTVMDAESLKRKIQSGEDCNEYLDRIITSNRDLLHRLDEIKSKFSLVSLNLSLTDVKATIDDALKKIDLSGIQLVYKYGDKTPQVYMDNTHMCEVFINLINNAVHAMKDKTKMLTVEISQEKMWAVITISDTGIGIEKENLNNIFVPFYTTKSKKTNWGIGLSYCFKVITAHKGKIFVESEVNKGTAFKILLPLIQ